MPYRLVFKGCPGQILNIGNLSLPSNDLKYLDALPVPIAVLKKVPGLTVDKVDEMPKSQDVVDKEKAEVTGQVGIKWDGTVQVRTTEFGKFTKGEVRWDLSLQVVEELAKRSGFVKIG